VVEPVGQENIEEVDTDHKIEVVAFASEVFGNMVNLGLEEQPDFGSAEAAVILVFLSQTWIGNP
jgi:hypothetical protein